MRRLRYIQTCEVCNVDFWITPSLVGVRFTCSLRCRRSLAIARVSGAITTFLTGNDQFIRWPLTKRKEALVDTKDVPLVAQYKWHAAQFGHNWYARTNITLDSGERCTITMHTLLMGSRSGHEVDHRDGNGLNNRRLNLRWATRTQNRANQRRSSSTSGVKGVYWHSRDKTWQSAIAGKHLGYFNSKEEAQSAYAAAAEQLYGEFACTTPMS